jgi:outer membrane murein-binding lipoprotein Lpp
MSYSAWLTDTARKEAAIRAGLAAVSQFERDHGTFTPEEVSAAEERAARALERASRTGSSTRRTG